MKYNAIIFDLEGVICSTDQYHFLAWKEICKELDISFSWQSNEKLNGLTRMEGLDVILQDHNREMPKIEKHQLAEKQNYYYRRFLDYMTPSDLDKDVLKTLDALRLENLKIALVSPNINTLYILKRTELENYFDVVVDGNMVSQKEQDSNLYLEASKKLGFSPHECLAVSSTSKGVQAAKKAGFDCVILGSTTYRDPTDYRIYNIRDVVNIIRLLRNA